MNVGSVGLQGYDDEHPHQPWIQVGSPHARYAMTRRENTGWQVQVRSVPYDFEPVVQQAQRPGLEDLGRAIAFGDDR